ncbi:reprolysin-like metallopeptidase [Pseudomonas kilonensis]|uniref:reprolysin-like metallopeptidase n=1 Tax=Pseudomonas kilonensis TaxID=132476 RepID=UPI003398DA6C
MNVENSFATARFSRLAVLMCALALPKLVNAATDDPQDLPQAMSASVYADAIGSARFERLAIKVEQGYTVESGNLYTRDGETGSLVVVRSPDGAILARIDGPGKRGLLRVDAQGISTFTAALSNDSRASDTVETQEPIGRDATTSEEHRYIDLLMAYSTYALGKMDVDPVAFALMQVEETNLRLRNSLITGVSLRLAAVNIFDVPYDTSSSGLASWQLLLSPYRTIYSTDLNAAYGGWDGGNAGRAYLPGYTSALGWTSSGSDTFAHEVAHNVGGRHCWDQNGSDYNFSHDNGKTKTSLCYGDRAPYFSNPAVRDTHGLPLGDAQTADMARVWRENAARLTGYNPELPGLRMMLVSQPGNTYGQATAALGIPGGESTNVAIVALSQEVGPIRLVANGLGNSSLLSVKLLNAEGNDVTVRLRASRLKERCKSPMNVYAACTGPFTTILRLEYTSIDIGNADLLPGYYNGLLELEAQSPDSDWKIPIKVAVSLRK